MAALSIGKAWEETNAFVKREAGLLFPVAFLFLALPVVIFQQMVPPELMQELLRADKTGAEHAAPQIPPTFWIGLLLALAIGLIGALTLYALALRPGISVAEAIRHAIRRLPMVLGAGLIVAAASFLLALFVGLLISGVALMGGGGAITAIMGSMVMGVFLFAAVRMLLLQAVVIDQPVGPIDAIRRSWAMTGGQFWRLMGFLIILIFVSLIVQMAVQAIFGVIGGIVGGAKVAVLTGDIATAAVSAVIQVYFMVMTARLYRQLSR